MELPSTICFVDLETTGTSARYGRIIEIGIIRVEDGKVVREYKQLVNPQVRVDPYIEAMTGISTKDLQFAPTFEDIKEEVLDILVDAVFVAHNVRFDYGFLRNEFKRCGITFSAKHFCTVKLTRLLFPEWPRHNLDSVIQHFDIACENRHRAYDDANVLYDFWVKAQERIDKEKLFTAVSHIMRKPTRPLNISDNVLDAIPESPGVYIFYGKDGSVLYIGKSINLKDRVLSHFSNDYLSSTDMKISQEVIHIETIKTAGELGALLLESTLIKKHNPLFNRKLRRARKMTILLKKQNEQGYNTIISKDCEQIPVEEIPYIVGVFKTKKQVKDFLYETAKAYQLCPKLLLLEKIGGQCFYSQLGYCKGACSGDERSIKYNLRFDEAFYKHKIKSWRFDTPIMIKEEGEFEEYHVIDKWCYLGSLKNEFDSFEELQKNYSFDFDTYKIITSFLYNKKIVISNYVNR